MIKGLGQSSGTFAIALIVVVGAFAYIIARGGSDPVVMPMLAGALGTVLSYFFAQHLTNGAASAAVATQLETNRATQTAVDHATAAAADATAAAIVATSPVDGVPKP